MQLIIITIGRLSAEAAVSRLGEALRRIVNGRKFACWAPQSSEPTAFARLVNDNVAPALVLNMEPQRTLDHNYIRSVHGQAERATEETSIEVAIIVCHTGDWLKCEAEDIWDATDLNSEPVRIAA